MSQAPNYHDLMTEIIKKQILILGPEIAILKARAVSGLKVRDSGQVIDVTGEPIKVLSLLIDKYVALSGKIVHESIAPFIAKYPELAEKLRTGG